MPFIHPALFAAGAAAASIPIIIHLLNRRRFRVRQWAAMKFLLDSLRKNRRRLRIEELILLAMRVLAVLLLAMGLARFTGCSDADAGGGLGDSGETIVYVLDDSVSMGQRLGNATIFNQATSELADRIRNARGGKIAIVLASQTETDRPLFELTGIANVQRDELAGRLTSLKPSDRRGDLAGSLERAAKLLETEHDAKRVVILSDFRKADLDKDAAARINEQYRKLEAAKISVSALNYGRASLGNLTVEGIQMLDRFALARGPVRVAVTVRNNGPTQVRDVEVALAGRIQSGQQVRDITLPAGRIGSIEAGATGRMEFVYTPDSAGSVVLTASVPADQLAGDNNGHLALDVRDALKVLIVDGQPDIRDQRDAESFNMKLALDPLGDGFHGVLAEVLAPSALGGVRFADYDMVMMLNVAELPRQYAEAAASAPASDYPVLESLQDYVRSGGGLAIFCGSRLAPAFYNGPLFADGNGLMPYRIGPHKGEPTKMNTFFRLNGESFAASELLKTFAGESKILASFIRFYAFNPADEMSAGLTTAPDVKAPVVIARFNDQQTSPAIASRQFGAGQVVVFFSSASASWNDWPSDPIGTYVAVMHDVVRYVARPIDQQLSGIVGKPVVYELPKALSDAKAVLKTPSFPASEMVSLPIQRRGPSSLVEYVETREAGIYDLTLSTPDGTSRQVLVARNVDGIEGRLDTAGAEGVAAALPADKVLYVDRATQTSDSTSIAYSKQYWAILLASVLALLAAETFLGQRFGHYT